jgi:hypothetical protein
LLSVGGDNCARAIATYITSFDGAEAMTETKAMPALLDLTDELLVASTLLAIMAKPEANKPLLLEMCASSVERCQALVEELGRIDRRLMSEGEK